MGMARMMLDFICELERAVVKWPENATWTLAQIADYTSTGVPQVVDFLSDTLDRELEVHETLTLAEAHQALGLLRERMATQLAARERRMAERREKAIRSYDLTMEKVRVLQATKNWRSAYKTLTYFVGRSEKDVSDELLLLLCGECLRLGIKAEASMPELSIWLRKGVAACLNAGSPAAIEDAIDFIDAYGDAFRGAATDESERGNRLIGSVLASVKMQAEILNIAPQFEVMVKDLRMT